MIRIICLLVLSIFLFVGCEKANIKAGETSLKGTWIVTKINTAYGSRTDLGTNTTQNIEESGTLGQFEFMEDHLLATYTRVDTTYELDTSWELKRDKVNEGFFRVERYSLCLNEQIFQCQFGDETKDAERNANEVRLIFETDDIGFYQQFVLFLEKE